MNYATPLPITCQCWLGSLARSSAGRNHTRCQRPSHTFIMSTQDLFECRHTHGGVLQGLHEDTINDFPERGCVGRVIVLSRLTERVQPSSHHDRHRLVPQAGHVQQLPLWACLMKHLVWRTREVAEVKCARLVAHYHAAVTRNITMQLATAAKCQSAMKH